MGIENIDILIDPDEPNRPNQALEEYQLQLIKAHNRGEHPFGSMLYSCPLCQAS